MSRRWFSSSAAALALLAALGWWLAGSVREGPPNVIVLTMESTRAADFTPEILPEVFKAARSGTRFTHHRAISAWTAPNVIALLSGLSSFEQGVHARDQSLPVGVDLPLRRLSADGWRVGGLQPFMTQSAFEGLGLTLEPGVDLRAWLARRALDRTPFLVWHHYLESHLPYAPPDDLRPDLKDLLAHDAGARKRIEAVMTQPAIPAGSVAFRPEDRPAIRALYLANLRAFDGWFAEFWRFLESSGLRDNTIVVLSADHGEEHLERGLLGHASTTRAAQLHEEIIRVPLVIWVPERLRSRLPPGERGDESHHTDLMPTLFDLLGLAAPRSEEGRSLLAPMPADRPWRAVTSGAGYAEHDPAAITRFVLAGKEGPWKAHLEMDGDASTKLALYSLADDPDERRDLAPRDLERARRMEADLRRARAEMVPPHMAAMGRSARAAERPRWVFPASSGTMVHGDFSGRFRLEWTGDSASAYVIEYHAGTGAMALSGEMQVAGTVKDFGMIDRAYWNRFVVPYNPYRVRVAPAGRADLWSDWLDLQAKGDP